MSGGNYVTLGPIPDAGNDGIQRTPIVLNSLVSTAATVVPAVAGKRIFVHAMNLSTTIGNTLVQVADVNTGGATVAIQGWTNIGQSGQINLPYSQYPWYTCAPGDALALSCQSGVTTFIYGSVLYVQG